MDFNRDTPLSEKLAQAHISVAIATVDALDSMHVVAGRGGSAALKDRVALMVAADNREYSRLLGKSDQERADLVAIVNGGTAAFEAAITGISDHWIEDAAEDWAALVRATQNAIDLRARRIVLVEGQSAIVKAERRESRPDPATPEENDIAGLSDAIRQSVLTSRPLQAHLRSGLSAAIESSEGGAGPLPQDLAALIKHIEAASPLAVDPTHAHFFAHSELQVLDREGIAASLAPKRTGETGLV